ncbi:MAG: C25 family cysteine peptidase [Euryarchaeota archaeon]|nr:C25 family cysteine peptidase [Euryarchaeota archaeon]
MKKRDFIVIMSILATLIMVVGSIQAGTIQRNNSSASSLQTKTISYQFSQPTLEENDQYATIHLAEVTGYRNIAGEPIIPVVMKTIELPFGTTVSDMRCVFTSDPEVHLTQKITPAGQPVPFLSDNLIIQPSENPEIYTKNQVFPATWYSYRLTGGLNKQNILTTFLTIQINPVRYNPAQYTIQSLNSITIDITYEPPSQTFSSYTDTYDMIIICKDSYARLLEPLVTHKNTHGIQTKLIPISDIYSETYFTTQGRDKPEQIKYFIKNAKETWNITYVMLVGNYAQVPTRYASLETDTGGLYEELRFVSDLYYADLYTANGSFSSWDTDNDGLYAEWPYPESHPQEDFVDLVPDVHVARLACMFKSEVKTMVDKIITYENTAAGTDWFNRIVVIGGDTFDKSIEGGTDYNEGEEATAKALEYMPQFIPVKLWASLGNLSLETIQNEISNGCGFLYFCGHGSPKSWATHNNGDYKNWTGMYKNTDMPDLTNKNMPPILIVGGCHNSELDSAPKNLLLGFLKEKFNYFRVNETWLGSYFKYNYALECWSWVFVKVKGGAIASTGSAGYGAVNIGDYNHDGIPDCTQGLDGWFELEFFRLYNQENITILGQTYDQVLTGYTQNFPVDTSRYDAKVLETHILLGDPSLKIGGYQ